MAIQAAVALIVGALMLILAGPMAGFLTTALGLAIPIVLVVGLFLLQWGYYLLFELVWNGQTPGKRLIGIRVIRENGYPIRAWDAVVRNIVRIIDGPPYMAMVGLLVMLLNRRSKRLGDFAAGTIVIREARLGTPSAIAADRQAPPLSLDPAEETLVRDFLGRRQRLTPAARAALAVQLSTRLARRYGLQPPSDTQAEAFLETLVGSA